MTRIPDSGKPGRKATVRRWVQVPARVAAATALLALLPTVASAQRLWNVTEVFQPTAAPPNVVVSGARFGPGEALVAGIPGTSGDAAAAGGLAAQVPSAEIRVTFDYLRLGFGHLELPLPDGSTIEVENAVFEDRGAGNLMWTGEVRGAGHESAVFTLQDGHLVGWFGEPGGPKYTMHADPDGRGSLAVEQVPTGDWCGTGEAHDHPHEPLGPSFGRAAQAAHPGGVAVASAESANTLDILALYTTGMANRWKWIGGAAVGIQQMEDYLNMVFRNGELPVTARLIAERWDPERVHPDVNGRHTGRQAGAFLWWANTAWWWAFETSPGARALRHHHRPDLVHFLPEMQAPAASGQAAVRASLDPSVLLGWSCCGSQVILAHEIGHNLGGHHEEGTFGDFVQAQAQAFRPWGFAHTDLTSCAASEGFDVLICPATALSYGQDTWDDPELTWSVEPYYSSALRRPNDWTLGVAGTSENERLFLETMLPAATSGEAVPVGLSEEFPIEARWVRPDTARITWPEGFFTTPGVVEDHWAAISVQQERVGNEEYFWAATGCGDYCSENVTTVGATSIDVAGLLPGEEHRMQIHPWRSAERFGAVVLPSPWQPGAPSAPSNLSSRLQGDGSVRLTWRDNSSNETGFEVWWRKWSGAAPDEYWRRYGETLPANARALTVDGLVAEEEILVTEQQWDHDNEQWVPAATVMRGRYSFVVVAVGDDGWSVSQRFDLEFVPGPHPEPTASGEFTNCFWRRTGIEVDGYSVRACVEMPDGETRRAWDVQLDSEQSGLLYFFDRDNVEVLIKILDGCRLNGHRWVFVAPVTDLAFRLLIVRHEPGEAWSAWRYDSQRRPQNELLGGVPAGNRQGQVARTVSDTQALPCAPAEMASAEAATGTGASPGPMMAVSSVVRSDAVLAPGSATACVPDGAGVSLSGGYTVSICYETYDGRVGDGLDWGLDSEQSALLYFFDRDNVEVLIKVLDACVVNRHRWVYVAPVTDVAFNLEVRSPDGEMVWTHSNPLGQTADTRADAAAFPCSS